MIRLGRKAMLRMSSIPAQCELVPLREIEESSKRYVIFHQSLGSAQRSHAIEISDERTVGIAGLSNRRIDEMVKSCVQQCGVDAY